MHRAMTGAGHEPNVSSFALHDDDAADPVLGRVVAQGRSPKTSVDWTRINNSSTLYQSGVRLFVASIYVLKKSGNRLMNAVLKNLNASI